MCQHRLVSVKVEAISRPPILKVIPCETCSSWESPKKEIGMECSDGIYDHLIDQTIESRHTFWCDKTQPQAPASTVVDQTLDVRPGPRQLEEWGRGGRLR